MYETKSDPFGMYQVAAINAAPSDAKANRCSRIVRSGVARIDQSVTSTGPAKYTGAPPRVRPVSPAITPKTAVGSGREKPSETTSAQQAHANIAASGCSNKYVRE